MKDLVFVSAQPDIPYFHWQTKLYTHNFIEKGINPKNIHVLFAMVDKNTPTEESLTLKKIGVNVHHYSDTRNNKIYIPSLRPMIMSEWLKNNPDLGKCYFYHDSDIIFRELPNFEKLLTDDICYVSDTISYIGYDYIMDCSKRYESVYPTLKHGELLQNMCNIIGINVETIRENQPNSGGAQYLIKNTDYMFWEKIFIDSIRLYDYMANFHKSHPIKHEIQMWTSDMWSVLWNLFYLKKNVRITNELDFSWATDSIEKYNQSPILHMAGVTPDLKGKKFYKGEFINVDPIEKLKNNENFFNYIEKNSATIKYIEVIRSFLKKDKMGIY